MANRVIVAVFATENHAYDAAEYIRNLDKDGVIQLKRGAIATKDAKGNLTIPDTKGVGSAWGLLGGGLIGGLLGAMLGPVGVAAGAAASAAATGAAVGAASGGILGSTVDLAEFGLSEDFVDDVSTQLEAGETALIAEVDEGSTESIDQAVRMHGGRAYRSEIV
ncbi:MAG TPA: hypothetical protein VFU22_16510 [Roseiflexaceae bacterium]|nr:hypothetical protein [Roseiflexaceae bacterium]